MSDDRTVRLPQLWIPPPSASAASRPPAKLSVTLEPDQGEVAQFSMPPPRAPRGAEAIGAVRPEGLLLGPGQDRADWAGAVLGDHTVLHRDRGARVVARGDSRRASEQHEPPSSIGSTPSRVALSKASELLVVWSAGCGADRRVLRVCCHQWLQVGEYCTAGGSRRRSWRRSFRRCGCRPRAMVRTSPSLATRNAHRATIGNPLGWCDVYVLCTSCLAGR